MFALHSGSRAKVIPSCPRKSVGVDGNPKTHEDEVGVLHGGRGVGAGVGGRGGGEIGVYVWVGERG